MRLIILLSQWYHGKSRYAPLHFCRLFCLRDMLVRRIGRPSLQE